MRVSPLVRPDGPVRANMSDGRDRYGVRMPDFVGTKPQPLDRGPDGTGRRACTVPGPPGFLPPVERDRQTHEYHSVDTGPGPAAKGDRSTPRDGAGLRPARPVARRAGLPPPRAGSGTTPGDALPSRRRRRHHRGLPAARIRGAPRPAGDRGPGLRRRAQRGRPLAQRLRRRSRSARANSAWSATCWGPRGSAGTSSATIARDICRPKLTSPRSWTGSASGGPAR